MINRLMNQVVYVLMAKRNISTLKISVVWNYFEILGLRHCGGEEGWIAYYVKGGVDQTTSDINLNTSLDTYIALVFIDNTEENKNR